VLLDCQLGIRVAGTDLKKLPPTPAMNAISVTRMVPYFCSIKYESTMNSAMFDMIWSWFSCSTSDVAHRHHCPWSIAGSHRPPLPAARAREKMHQSGAVTPSAAEQREPPRTCVSYHRPRQGWDDFEPIQRCECAGETNGGPGAGDHIICESGFKQGTW